MNKQLINHVKELVAEVDATHRYSMSRIYALHNETFGADEKPQSCASCLIRKVNELKKWLETADAEARGIETPARPEAAAQPPKRMRKKKGA